jgi:hypothetical protein
VYSTEIYNALNVTAITSLLNTYGTGYALFSDMVIPADCEVKKTINFYQLGTIDCRLNYGLARYTVNCRAETQGEAMAIAIAVVNAINLETYTTYRLYCQIYQGLPPQDNTDVYNIPIEVTIKRK